MIDNPLRKLGALGQSIWLDRVQRDLITSGRLHHLIEDDALSGLASNAALFERAVGAGSDYDEEILGLMSEGRSDREICQAITRRDVQSAADKFHSVYEASDGADGYVSLEIDPRLANDAAGSIAEARLLWHALRRPNVMIQVPGTLAGLSAIRHLISDGINVQVTLLFSLRRYRQVIDAYLAGLETRLARGLPLGRVASVASFAINRIDILIDPMLDRLIVAGGARADAAKAAHGRVAIASAKLAAQMHEHVFAHERFQALRVRGARTQRLLWAATGVKDPLHSDVKYVEALIGLGTVTALSLETLDAYHDHGEPQVRLRQDLGEARSVIESLPALEINFEAASAQLEQEEVKKLVSSSEQLLQRIGAKHSAVA